MINIDHLNTRRTVAENGSRRDMPETYQNRTPEERETCEQKRAREYGLEEYAPREGCVNTGEPHEAC